jgi:hypothetical protein
LIIVQTPLTQAASALGNEQTLPQAPQLATSDCMSTHLAPHLSGLGAMQVATHVWAFPELAQNGASALQAMPQAPQVSGRLMLVSQPSFGIAVQ